MYDGQIMGNCASDNPYTGVGTCPKQEGVTQQIALTALDADYPAEKDAFLAALDGYVSATGNTRMFPVKGIVAMPISGGDVNAPDLGATGGPRPVNLNAKNQGFQIDSGDCSYKELSKLNGRKMRLFRLDNQQFLYGTAFKKNDEVRFRGYEGIVYVQRTPSDGSTAYNLTLWFYYSTNNELEEKNMHAIALDRELPDGLVGVVLAPGSAALTAKVVTACGSEDITADYGTDWDTSMFVNSAGTAPTTVTYSATTGELTFAPAGSYKVATASVLETGGISGVEGVNTYLQLQSA